MTAAVGCLMIGGPADGQHLIVKAHWSGISGQWLPEEYKTVAEYPPVDMMPTVQPLQTEYKTTTYKRHELHENGHTYWVYISEPWKHKSVVAALIAGYRKGGAG